MLSWGFRGESHDGGGGSVGVELDDRAARIARNVAAAPPFTAETIEKLAVLVGPVAAEVRRSRRKPKGARQ